MRGREFTKPTTLYTTHTLLCVCVCVCPNCFIHTIVLSTQAIVIVYVTPGLNEYPLHHTRNTQPTLKSKHTWTQILHVDTTSYKHCCVRVPVFKHTIHYISGVYGCLLLLPILNVIHETHNQGSN